jgi:hypothetical protein
MSRSIVRAAVVAHIAAGWTFAPVITQNVAGSPPEQTGTDPTPYLFIEISNNSTEQASTGEAEPDGNRWDEYGQVFFHIYTPSGSGVALSDQYADAIVDLFRGQTLATNIEFHDFSGDVGGPGDVDGNYYRVSVSVDWIRRGG